jgi:type IV pilus assembly protein PilX
MSNDYKKLSSQQGSVLITVIILVLILTVTAISEVSFNSTQTRIATNSADRQIAFMTAEGALSQGINNLLAGTYPTTGFLANTSGLFVFNPNNAPLWTTIGWTSSAVIPSYQGNSNTQGAFFIEQLPSITLPGQNMSNHTWIYRITARAVGASGNSPVILQATVQIPQ